MAVITWLLLSLLTVQTVAGRGLRQRDITDTQGIRWNNCQTRSYAVAQRLRDCS